MGIYFLKSAPSNHSNSIQGTNFTPLFVYYNLFVSVFESKRKLKHLSLSLETSCPFQQDTSLSITIYIEKLSMSFRHRSLSHNKWRAAISVIKTPLCGPCQTWCRPPSQTHRPAPSERRRRSTTWWSPGCDPRCTRPQTQGWPRTCS